ncbi:hypothetical protein KC319_g4428 [Hortaea werneckii]|nr:hypothetical protein KC319_g4428 [Hortaea werneckii]
MPKAAKQTSHTKTSRATPGLSSFFLYTSIRTRAYSCADPCFPSFNFVQIITQHEPYEIICEDTNLGLKRTDQLVFIQVFQQGRTAEVKQQFYAKLAERLKAECGLEGGDLLVTCLENRKEDWSFGNGEAQFLTGAL